MYVRPRSMVESFIVESKTQSLNEIGRVNTKFEYKATGEVIHGILAGATTTEVEKWKQLQHEVSHTIVDRFNDVKAKEGDRLINGSRVFYVQGVDDVSMFGYYTLYYVKERNDGA